MQRTQHIMIATIAGLGTGCALAGDVNPAAVLNEASPEGSAGSTTIFNLFDHPGGIAEPQAYGLRLDGFVDGAAPITFSFEDASGASTVHLVVTETDGGATTLNISGTVTGNSSDGGVDYGTFAIDLTYEVDPSGDGWEGNNMNDGDLLGGLTGLNTTSDSPIGNGDFFDLLGKSDGSDAFRFLSDGYRLSDNTNEWVGRGWVMGSGSDGTGVNDLLFTAQIIPLPPAALGGIGMLAGLGAYRRLRRRD